MESVYVKSDEDSIELPQPHFIKLDEISSSTVYNTSNNNLSIPEKSRQKYEDAYKKLCIWQENKELTHFSEDILMDYFKDLSKIMKPSSLWSHYSMIKFPLLDQHNIDMSSFNRLKQLLKHLSQGYKPKKSKTLTVNDISRFLNESSDKDWLLIKVSLIFGLMGACRKDELCKITIGDVQDLNSALLVTIPTNPLDKLKFDRSFIVSGHFYGICKKYMELRPANVDRFFLSIRNGKCTKNPVGINTFGKFPSKIAEFLKLPHPELYTGRCFRKSGKSIVGEGNLGNRNIAKLLKLSTETEEQNDDDSSDTHIDIRKFNVESSENIKNDGVEHKRNNFTSNSEHKIDVSELVLASHVKTEYRDMNASSSEHKVDVEASTESSANISTSTEESRNGPQQSRKRIKVEVIDEPDVPYSQSENHSETYHTGNSTVSINFNNTTINIHICCNNRK